MASSSGTSSGSTLIQNSGSDEDLQQLMDLRKRKRMLSNRESAKRSRMRKQKHLDELVAQVDRLRREENQIISTMNVTTQQFLNIEEENSILRARVTELTHRLEYLNEVISCFLNVSNGGFGIEEPYTVTESIDVFLNNSWNDIYMNQHIMASADILQY